MRLPRIPRRRRVRPAVVAGPDFPAAAALPPLHVRTAARRACGAIQLASLDGRRDDLAWLIAGLDDATLRETCREMTIIWTQAITLTGCRTGMREAVEADAWAQATLPDDSQRA